MPRDVRQRLPREFDGQSSGYSGDVSTTSSATTRPNRPPVAPHRTSSRHSDNLRNPKKTSHDNNDYASNVGSICSITPSESASQVLSSTGRVKSRRPSTFKWVDDGDPRRGPTASGYNDSSYDMGRLPPSAPSRHESYSDPSKPLDRTSKTSSRTSTKLPTLHEAGIGSDDRGSVKYAPTKSATPAISVNPAGTSYGNKKTEMPVVDLYSSSESYGRERTFNLDADNYYTKVVTGGSSMLLDEPWQEASFERDFRDVSGDRQGKYYSPMLIAPQPINPNTSVNLTKIREKLPPSETGSVDTDSYVSASCRRNLRQRNDISLISDIPPTAGIDIPETPSVASYKAKPGLQGTTPISSYNSESASHQAARMDDMDPSLSRAPSQAPTRLSRRDPKETARPGPELTDPTYHPSATITHRSRDYDEQLAIAPLELEHASAFGGGKSRHQFIRPRQNTRGDRGNPNFPPTSFLPGCALDCPFYYLGRLCQDCRIVHEVADRQGALLDSILFPK
ncbi:hypothetical protein V8F20_010523 [Naviculisporaceae sp. PSN 640]